MPLHVQDFCRSFPSWDEAKDALAAQYAIKATQHGKYPNLWLLKYAQIESPFKEPLVQECRGIILDISRDYAVVSHPYHKFFNQGESLAATLDWATAMAWEKLDGSLISLYHYDNSWHCATSGTPDASGPVGDEGMTFSDLFWSTFRSQGLSLDNLNPTKTYMMELCAPQNRVVVIYPEPKLYLHGVRDLATGQEESPEGYSHVVPLPRRWPLTSPEECQTAAEALAPLEQEGYVVVDSKFNRLKVKSPSYVAIHHAKDSLSKRRIADLIRMGEGSEFLAYFPQLQAIYDDLKHRYDSMLQDAGQAWEEHKAVTDQKSFALRVKHLPYAGGLFLLKAGKAKTVAQWVASLTEPAYHRLLGI
jgi:hypothetical protein